MVVYYTKQSLPIMYEYSGKLKNARAENSGLENAEKYLQQIVNYYYSGLCYSSESNIGLFFR